MSTNPPATNIADNDQTNAQDISHEAFWHTPTAALFDRVQSSRNGLTAAAAADRMARFGANTAAAPIRRGIAGKIARRFAEPLIAILIFAAAISLFTGDTASFAISLTVISLSIVLDVVQEHRAETAAEALQRSVAIQADVLRDGTLRSLPVDKIVPGDVVHLRAGDLVPADGILIEGRNAHTNEALLTGEPYPVEKRQGDCNAAEPADAFNALFAGTSLINGEATMLVVTTGKATRLGGIAAGLAIAEPPSALERGVHRLSLLILRLTIFLVLFVVLVNLAFGRPMLEAFLFSVALAVGLTPELLPMVMTVTLSRGAIRMAKKRVIVKRLAAIHDLGAMDVLCTDKTGTLTEAKIALLAYPGFNSANNDQVLTLAAINSEYCGGIRSPLDVAIAQQCADKDLKSWSKIDEIPFDYERRQISVLVEKDGRKLLILKGAPEAVLPRGTAVDLGGGRTQPLDAATRTALERQHTSQAEQSYRVLAVASKEMPAGTTKLRAEDETDLVIAGFCVFFDPPKPSAADAVSRLAKLGVRVKVISGDHEAVVRHVAETIKMPVRDLLTGAEIEQLTELALIARVETTDLFARVSPDQKTRIIKALQSRGYSVGFVGDGVNDAPAIRAAEIGFSVEGAADVARSAADMILLAPDLGVLADGVEEGRRVFANITKYVRMGTSSNFGNMLSMALASLLLPFLPLLPIQILLNNLIYDVSEIGIPFDSVDRRDVATPRTWDMKVFLRFTLVMGALSSIFDLATFAVLLRVYGADAESFRTAWFIESMATQILVIFIIRTRGHAWLSRAHPALVATSLGALAVALIVGLSPLGAIFHFVPLPLGMLAAIAGIVIAYLVLAEGVKRLADRGIKTPSL